MLYKCNITLAAMRYGLILAYCYYLQQNHSRTGIQSYRTATRVILLIWTWLYASAVDWMEAHLNVSLQSIVGNMQGLSELLFEKSLTNVTREKSYISHKDMHEWTVHNKIHNKYKKQDRVDFTSMLTWKKTDWFRQSTIKSKGFIYRLGSGFNVNFHVDLYSYTAWYSSHLKVHNTCCVTCNQYE